LKSHRRVSRQLRCRMDALQLYCCRVPDRSVGQPPSLQIAFCHCMI
jgi:hypothetical protein